MGTNPAVSQLYEHFAPPERLTLTLEAMARGDDAEAARLKDTCPRKAYTQADAAYDDRIRLSFEIMTVVCIDLRSMWAKLHMLEWCIGAMRNLATWQQINASMAFLDGEQFGLRRPQIGFFARHERDTAAAEAEAEQDDEGEAEGGQEDGEEDDEDVSAAAAEEPDLKEMRMSKRLAGEFARRMIAVEDRTQYATDLVLAPLLAAAAAIAQDLVNVWAAYGRFCRTRLGVAPEVMMRAWEMPLLADLEQMLTAYAAVQPQPEKVAEYATYCCANWDGKFGGGEEDDDDAD